MSTTTASAHAQPARTSPSSLTFMGVLRSELIKFRSLMSTRLLVLFTLVAVVGVGALAAWLRGQVIHEFMLHGAGAGPRGGGGSGAAMTQAQAESAAAALGLNLYGIPAAGLQIGILVLGALAVLLIAGEFSTGMIRSSMAAVPKRLPVFWAKAIVLVVVSYVVTLVASLLTFLVSIPILHSYGITMNFGIDGVVYGIFMGGLYVAGVSLIGLSLGTLLRNNAGAIITLVALFFVVPFATQFLSAVPGDFWKYVGQYTPSIAGGRMLEIGDKAAFISPLAGGMIFLAWIVVLTVPAVVALKTRDV
ncbi:ABC transporter [Arthrobacter sp. ERGS1:01]|uniref:ABC transporter n=1 Tax=Arthrobacter sp. ERGS1:01 TaxID=1704044 RepID=UPI0006B64528|nr:ABC transporter [Arthrobacter sp. ERGS1:01]ALE07472.1 ABC transporter [Arthrobacter sp. ERGS1:01]